MSAFNFKDLLVWQKSIDFAAEIILLVDSLSTHRKHYRLIENLESAVTSISCNIAEGKGRYSKKEFRQFLFIARGSLYETSSILFLFKRLNRISSKTLASFESQAIEIGKMVNGLINSIKTEK